MFELNKQFRFESAHTLPDSSYGDSRARIHGHSYRAEVTLRGMPDAKSGMLVDFEVFERALNDAQKGLDHRLLDDVKDLGAPTMENLASWIWNRLSPQLPKLAKVTVFRDSCGESCAYYGPNRMAAE
jgi:6-pyruvoyltetrahydropterin/6-carboxytetrahydropterin synthase